ncbi:MAG TPA: glycosyltransferase [Vicinamibacterales bacterium]|nr:glycosyltransferase [Vicinamibacterales bacterium]
MRILHVIPAVAARYGGPSTAVVGMCRALSTLGHEVLLASTDADGRDGRIDPAAGTPDLSGIQVVFFPRQASESFKWSAPMARWLRERVADFDVVHIHAVFSHACLAAGRACRRAGVPYIVRPLGTLDPWSLSRHAWRKQVLLTVGGRGVLEHASLIHYTTAEEGRLAQQALPWLPEGVVVPLGVDAQVWRASGAASPQRGGYVLALSRLDDKKGVDVLIRAFHLAAADAALASWKLIIAGDGEPALVASLRALAAGGPAASRIEFAGWVGGDTRARLLAGADVFALASHQENFGIAVAEALACGTPAVVSRAVNLAADIEQGSAGWVCERDETAFAQALVSAARDAGDRRQRGENARALAQRFRWPAVASQLTRVYEDVIAKRERLLAGTGHLPIATPTERTH